MEEDSYDLFRRDSSSQQLSEEVINAVDSPQRTAVRNESLAHELNNLNRAKERFKVFLEELNELKRTPIREDVINYCGEQRRSYKVIENYSRPESLIKKMDVRIDK